MVGDPLSEFINSAGYVFIYGIDLPVRAQRMALILLLVAMWSVAGFLMPPPLRAMTMQSCCYEHSYARLYK